MTDTHQLLLAIDPIILLLSLGVVAVVTTRHVGLSPIVGYLAIGLALRAAGHTAFMMSINVSQAQFRHPHFLEACAVAEAIMTIITAPRGVHLSLIEVNPEAPVKDLP